MMTLLTDWQGANPAGWIVQEKLDGWRVLWNGSNYITRGGEILPAPKSWLVGMPNMVLDGELFAGRGGFYAIQRLIKSGFSGLQFCVFDAPSGKTFSNRLADLAALALPGHCRVVDHVRCKGEDHWLKMADEIVDAGGEGIVGRPPKSIHTIGRDYNAQRWVPQCPSLSRRKVHIHLELLASESTK